MADGRKKKKPPPRSRPWQSGSIRNIPTREPLAGASAPGGPRVPRAQRHGILSALPHESVSRNGLWTIPRSRPRRRIGAGSEEYRPWRGGGSPFESAMRHARGTRARPTLFFFDVLRGDAGGGTPGGETGFTVPRNWPSMGTRTAKPPRAPRNNRRALPSLALDRRAPRFRTRNSIRARGRIESATPPTIIPLGRKKKSSTISPTGRLENTKLTLLGMISSNL